MAALFRLIVPSNAAHVNTFPHDFSSSRVPDRADGIRSAGSRRSIAALEPPAERAKDGPAYLRTIAATAGRTGGLGSPVGASADDCGRRLPASCPQTPGRCLGPPAAPGITVKRPHMAHPLPSGTWRAIWRKTLLQRWLPLFLDDTPVILDLSDIAYLVPLGPPRQSAGGFGTSDAEVAPP